MIITNLTYDQALSITEPKDIYLSDTNVIVYTGEHRNILKPFEPCVAQERYTSDKMVINHSITINGGTFSTSSVDQHILSFLDNKNPYSLFGAIDITGVLVKDQPQASSNNFGAITIANVDQGLIYGNRTDNTETGIRLSYILQGVPSQYSIVALNHIKKARNFGIEHIETHYPLTIGNVIHNNGVTVGSHGLRYTAANLDGMKGAVSSANFISDRNENGVSVQKGVKNLVLTGSIIKNVTQDGFRANVPYLWQGHHLVQVSVIDAGEDAIKLQDLSHCLVDATTTGSGVAGVRVGNAVDDGHHLVRVISKGDTKAAVVKSDYNHCTIIADECNSYSCVEITGNYNIVDTVITSGNTVSLFITGSDNIIRIIQRNPTSIGIRLEGNRNHLTVNISSNIVITGNDNRIYGRVEGTIDNTGMGNDLSNVF